MKKIQDDRISGPEAHNDSIVYHGGDLAAARRLFPQAPEPWIDLSTGINPGPYPIPPLSPEIFAHLPDHDRLAKLETAARRRYGVPAHADVVAAPGTQALIQLLPQLHHAANIGILGFTYGEYERIWRAAGFSPHRVETLDALAACDLAIIVNPNNPDGRRIKAQDLSALAIHLAGKGGLLVVDEAFIDLLPQDESLVPILPQGALVLRSFGKTYGLPGLRLGFAIAQTALAVRLQALLGPWAVSGPAIEIGRMALADDLWVNALPQRLARQARFIEALFTQLGAEKIGGTPLFQLFAHAQAQSIFESFSRAGILLRRFPERPHWLRVGLAAEAFEERVAAVIPQIRKSDRL